MRKTTFLPVKPLQIKQKEYNHLLEPNEIFRASVILITALLLTYVSIYCVLNIKSEYIIIEAFNLLPLLLSIVLLFSVYQKAFKITRHIIICYLIVLLTGVMFYNEEISCSKVLILPALILLFFDKSKQDQLWGGVYWCVTYIVLQSRFYMFELKEELNHSLLYEIITIVFGIAFFLACFWVKDRFLKYRNEIKRKTLMLEQKNCYLQDLVLLNEKKNDALMRTVLLKEKLISILSPDISTPVNYFGLVINKYEKGYINDEELLKRIVEAKEGLIGIDKLVADLLSWSAPGEAKNTRHIIRSEEYDEIMQFVLSLYHLSAKTKGLEIVSTVHIPPAMCLSISKNEIEIILRNTLANAIKFSKPGGKIMIDFQLLPENAWAVLSIKDFGVGMDKNILQQLNNTHLTSIKGSHEIGVGLSIVFDIINSNSLRYNISSSKPEGTEVSIMIPVINI